MSQPQGHTPVNVLAIITLVLGLLSIAGTCFTGVPAVICGHWALAQLRAEEGRQRGAALARFGLFFGYFGIVVAILFAVGFFIGAIRAADSPSISTKADLFEHDLAQRFDKDGQILCKLKLPTDERAFVAYNMPDNAYMTGMYLGTQAWRYAATHDLDARDRAMQSLTALELLATVSGKPGLLARAAWPVDEPMDDDGIWHVSADGRYKWRGDVSSDQMTGVFFGLATAHQHVADNDAKQTIAAIAAPLAAHLLDNGRRIIGYDGEPTQWGNYTPEYVRGREPMNALLYLQHMKTAAHVTGEQRFAEAYHQAAFDDGYADLAVRARHLGEPRRVNHSDDVLILLALLPLLELETDEALHGKYVESLRRAWKGNEEYPGIKPEGNPFYAFAAARYLDDESGLDAARLWFERFPLDMKWNRDTIETYSRQFGFTFDPEPRSPAPEPGAPVPIDRRPKSWSALVANPYRDAGGRTADSGVVYNGHDYLITYWQGRYYGYLNASD